jgi:flavin-binding protein dodecin
VGQAGIPPAEASIKHSVGKMYKLIELVGISERSAEDAIHHALSQASQALKGLACLR